MTFMLHMKPNDNVPANRCVRIYFEWDKDRKKIVVGWVGQHLT